MNRADLEECRANLGQAPRKHSLGERIYWKLWLPDWCRMFNALRKQYRHQKKLRVHGSIHLGCFVKANAQLYEEGGWDAPAYLVWTPDPFFEEHPEQLRDIARQLFDMKDTKPSDRELQAVAKRVSNELKPFLSERLPDSITGGGEVYDTCVGVHQDHLPGGYLADRLVPVLTYLEKTPAVMILPGKLWGDRLAQAWGGKRDG